MSLLAYAVAEGDAAEIEGVGLEERPLIGIGHDGLALVVSEHESPLPEATAQTLWRYEDVVERLMDRQPILPARFGSVLADEDEAVSALRTRRNELRRRLTQVRGAVELGVRATWAQPPTHPQPGTGTEYLLGRLEVQRRAQRAANSLDPLLALARAHKVTVLPRPSVPVLASYLVDRDRTHEFIELATQIGQTEFDDGELIVTGPWPPYSFAQTPALDSGPHGDAE